MRTWNTPNIQDLDVRLTASSGKESNKEQAGGFVNGSFYQAEFDSNIYVREAEGCIMSIENKAALAS